MNQDGEVVKATLAEEVPLPQDVLDENAQHLWTVEQFMQIQVTLLELAHDAILIRDLRSRVLSWNEGAKILYGWSADEAIGQVTHELLRTHFPEGIGVVDASLQQQGQWEGELLHTRKDGSQIVVESRQVLVRDDQQQPLAILEVNRDISAHKAELARLLQEARAEEAERQRAELDARLARESSVNSQYRLMLAQRVGHIGTFEWHIPSNHILWTPELEALYGLPPGGFEGKYENWAQRVHPEDLNLAEENLQNAVAGGPAYNIEFRVVWPDHTIRWVLAKGDIVQYDGDGHPIRMIGVNIDITERKLAEEEKVRINRELQDLNANLEAKVVQRTEVLNQVNLELQRSNQELQEFAYVASHDLQEPLRKIQAFGNLLEEEFGQVLAEGLTYLDRMRNAAARMQVLINDLLIFSRVTTKALPPSMVDLAAIARGVVDDLDAKIRTTQGKVDVGPLPMIDADPLQMRQLLQNLIANALKFHRPGIPPVVTVTADVVTQQEEEASRDVADGLYCRLSVADNGIGFDEKYLDRIFIVFQRLHGRSDYEGTGIGLAVVRKIVERHGGSITATSIKGQGSTFVVMLPVSHKSKEEDSDVQ
jgi:PAS domain S-box-containing protein